MEPDRSAAEPFDDKSGVRSAQDPSDADQSAVVVDGFAPRLDEAAAEVSQVRDQGRHAA